MNLFIYLYRIPALLLAISVHEFSHGYVSYKLGDPTPKLEGRLTLNPLAHLDPIGILMLWIIGFGWAKPVMINPMYYKDSRKGVLLTSLAGPLSNVLLAFITLLITYNISFNIGILGPILRELYWYNIVLAVFNIIPVPPLDGSKVFYSLLPFRYSYRISQYESYGQIILLILLFTGIISKIMNPLIYLLDSMLKSVLLVF